MGMYDTVYLNCPSCGVEVEFQSKAGACNLEEYRLGNIPSRIAGDLDGEVAWCPQCDTNLLVSVQFFINIIPRKREV